MNGQCFIDHKILAIGYNLGVKQRASIKYLLQPEVGGL